MEKVFIQNDKITLEARYFESRTNKEPAVLICHPHPLYGGNFNNNVVLAVFDALINNNISCLKFNFRGVGLSTGIHTAGLGELKDVTACLNFLIHNKNQDKLIVCGYSYGAAIGCSVVARCANVLGYIAISFPWDFMGGEYKKLSQTTKPKLFIQGDKDQIAFYSNFQHHFDFYQEPKIKHIIKGADHLYMGYESEVAEKVLEFCGSLNKK
ncbi:MAG: hypothetical protein JW891_06820 [Candidatus Lokiarchaeota archaeon]|nr:hypothetical protein [Candidatus Lokiarchaeota archaeon]